MLPEVLPRLRCPVAGCGRRLTADTAPGNALRCVQGHSFDVARQGYVSLLTGRVAHPGDSAAMVAARERFLGSGAYAFLAHALATAARESLPGGGTAVPGDGTAAPLVLDAGAGTGYYLAHVLDALPHAVGLAVDVSAPALRRAARAHPRAAAVRADAWRGLPAADDAADVVLDVFAPRHGAEYARVLAPHGRLLVATPTGAHLAQLARDLVTADGVRLLTVDPEKPERVAARLGDRFRLVDTREHTAALQLSHAQVRALVTMGPSGAHTDEEALARAVAALPEPYPVTAAVRLARYAPLEHRVTSTGRSPASRGEEGGAGR